MIYRCRKETDVFSLISEKFGMSPLIEVIERHEGGSTSTLLAETSLQSQALRRMTILVKVARLRSSAKIGIDLRQAT